MNRISDGPAPADGPSPAPSVTTDPDDRRLLRAHLDGDPEAFTELIRRHRDRLWAVAMRTLGDREEAADALQDALISAFRNAASYRGEAAVTTWLHRVVVNACLDRMRRRKARPSVPLPETEISSPRDDQSAVDARVDIHSALRRLPEQQRAAIVLVDLQEFSVAEAAARLGVAEGTVKSRCSRGRLELARILGADARGGGKVSGASLASGPPEGTSSAAEGNPTGTGCVESRTARVVELPDATTSGGGR